MPMHPSRLVYILAAVAIAACNPYRCTYETRFIGTTGSTDAANGILTIQYVNTRGYREDGPVPDHLTWSIGAERLSSPATTLTLRSAQGQVVRELSISSPSAVSMTAGSSVNLSAAEHDAVFDLLASGGASVVLQLQSGATISAPLRVSSREDWHRPSCD